MNLEELSIEIILLRKAIADSIPNTTPLHSGTEAWNITCKLKEALSNPSSKVKALTELIEAASKLEDAVDGATIIGSSDNHTVQPIYDICAAIHKYHKTD